MNLIEYYNGEYREIEKIIDPDEPIPVGMTQEEINAVLANAVLELMTEVAVSKGGASHE